MLAVRIYVAAYDIESILVSGIVCSSTGTIAAYAEAWALTYYLVETQPREYAKYLALTADRPPFTEYSQQDRLRDFITVFGSDLRMFDARFQRFMSDVK